MVSDGGRGLRDRVGAEGPVAPCGPCLGSGAVAGLAGRDAEREAARRAQGCGPVRLG